MVVTMRKTSYFFTLSGNLFWPNHLVFPESSCSFAIMLISSCVYYFLWLLSPGLGGLSCFGRGRSLTGMFTLSLDTFVTEILVGEGASEKCCKVCGEKNREL